MAHAEHTVNVQKPIAEVFAFLVDGLNDPKWRPTVTSITHVSGSGVGATQSNYENASRDPKCGGEAAEGARGGSSMPLMNCSPVTLISSALSRSSSTASTSPRHRLENDSLKAERGTG
jgi:hypothetical protein